MFVPRETDAERYERTWLGIHVLFLGLILIGTYLATENIAWEKLIEERQNEDLKDSFARAPIVLTLFFALAVIIIITLPMPWRSPR